MTVKSDHVFPNVKFAVEPDCKCGTIKRAFEEKLLFASRFANDKDSPTWMYMVTTDDQGNLYPKDGVTISFCPSCGDKVMAKRAAVS